MSKHMALALLVSMLLACCESARVKLQISKEDTTQTDIQCYITERSDQVNYGLAFVIPASPFTCNYFHVFDKDGPWDKEVLQNTFSPAAAGKVCSCSLQAGISAEEETSHTFVIGKFGLQCDAKSCFESYAHQMFAAAKYRETARVRVLAFEKDHWVVSQEAGAFQATNVPTVIGTVAEIRHTLVPEKQGDLDKDLADQGGAVISDVVDTTPTVRVTVVEEISIDDASVAAEISQSQVLDEKKCDGKMCYHGTCINSECVCDDDYIGDECDVAPQNRLISANVAGISESKLVQDEGARVAFAARRLKKVVPLSHREGKCSNLASPSTGITCGPIKDVFTCQAARAALIKSFSKYSHGPQFPAFADYSGSTKQKLRDSVPGFCSAKINGKEAWHVKFNGDDLKEPFAPYTRKDAHTHYKVLCGCVLEGL